MTHQPLFVLINGKQGSGKDTLADGLISRVGLHCRVKKYTFAEPLREMSRKCLGVLDYHGIKTPQKDGPLMQMLGDWARQYYGDDVFIKILRNKVERDNPDIAIVSDLRLQSELLPFLPDAVTIRLDCPERVRRERILSTPGQSWRENALHKTEIDLDYYDKWSARIDTETTGPDAAIVRVVNEIQFFWERRNS